MKIIYIVFFLSFILFISSCNKGNKVEIKNDIGVVDLYRVKKYSKTYQAIQEQLDNIKDDLQKQLSQNNDSDLRYFLVYNFEQKKEELMKNFNKKLKNAIFYTANQEKIGIVVSYTCMPYGGVDLTPKVIENLDNGNLSDMPMYNNVEIISYAEGIHKNDPRIDQIMQQLYQEKKIYVLIDKTHVFLGGFDFNEKLPKESSKINKNK